MMGENHAEGTVKFVTVTAPNTSFYAIDDKEGNVIHVYDAALIRLLSERFCARYEVFVPPDDAIGARLPDGNWTGIVGMVRRSEADLGMASITVTEERSEAVYFSYPHSQTILSFMADKPEPLSKNFAMFYPFSLEIWIVLVCLLIVTSLVFYTLVRKKQGYSKVLLRMFGSLLEQSFDFEVSGLAFRLLALAWFCGAMILINSYKALLLSFLSFPTMTGIRDIADLSRAAAVQSVDCFSYKGSYVFKYFLESDDPSRRALGNCLRRNEMLSGNPDEFFTKHPRKKAFIGGQVYLKHFGRDFFVSDDSFRKHLYAIAISERFCCPKYLNQLIHRCNAAGLIEKFMRDEQFFMQLQTSPVESGRSDKSGKLTLDDVTGAFYILIFGWVLASLILLAEVLAKKAFLRNR